VNSPVSGEVVSGDRERWRGRSRSSRRTTPSRLRVIAGAAAVAVAVACLLAIFVTASRQSASQRARVTTGQDLIEAQTLYTSLADADSSAAGSSLAGPAGDAALDQRYRSDLAQASSSLAHLAQGPAGSDEAAAVEALTTYLPVYSGVVETARVDNRQGELVGAAYLGEANTLMRDRLLPAADLVYQGTRVRLDDAYATATRAPLVILTVTVFLVALGLLVVLLWWLGSRFRRIVNVPIAVAMVLVAVAGAWTAVALSVQGNDIARARRQGSDPISSFTQARILGQQLRGDDELTLVSRDTVASYQQDYATADLQLRSLLDSSRAGGSPDAPLQAASAVFTTAQTLHAQIRNDVASGQPTQAIAKDTGPAADDAPAVADHFDTILSAGVESTRARFDDLSAAALDDLRWLIAGVAVLGVAAVTLVIVGTRRRLAEYR